MAATTGDLLQGTLAMLILKALLPGEPTHGYGIAEWIERITDDVLRVEEGSLYPALYRMTRKGWIEGEWGVSDNNRRARFYQLTRLGRRELRTAQDGWRRYARAVSRVLDTPA